MMFVPIVAGMFFSRKRKAIEILPESMRTLWNKWELRSMVIISFCSQSILMVIGNRRKHSRKKWVRIMPWLAYLWADTIATASLGMLSSNQGESEGVFVDPHYVITVFWAPFLLLHLGGPDTITAYSLEDNELWLRHLLNLLVQVGGAIYVFLTAWTITNSLYIFAIPLFFAGIIKYGERTWVLRSASSEHFRDSMLPDPNPGPNYPRLMEEIHSKEDEGFIVQPETTLDIPIEEDHSNAAIENNSSIPEAGILSKAYIFFEIFKKLPADLILSFDDIMKSQRFIQESSCDKAWKVIEVELGFMYDVFYTKAVLVHSFVGCVLRLITFSCTIAVFVAFFRIEKHIYLRVDVIITYILLVGAILLETYAVIVLVCSDWTILWLSKYRNFGVYLVYCVISLIPSLREKRWSNSVGQYNLISYCLEDKPAKCRFIQKVLCISKLLKYRYQTSKEVLPQLKNLIFEELLKKISTNGSDLGTLKKLCACRGDWVLKANANSIGMISKGNLDILKWSFEVEFDQSILIWHIATDLCYYHNNCIPYCEASKLLSDYMLNLLVMCPFMLPNGIGEIRFRDTCAEARAFFKERKHIITEGNQARKNLLDVKTIISPSEVKGNISKSVLFDACRLANSLQSLKTEAGNKKMWEFAGQVWVEMLCYAASQCGGSDHAQQLRRGGELLTHVWLLMAHLGLTEQSQILQGPATVKLSAY